MTKEQEYLDRIKQLEEDNAILYAQCQKLIELSKFQWDVIQQMNKEKRRKNEH
mgnify:CR=1 FL=1